MEEKDISDDNEYINASRVASTMFDVLETISNYVEEEDLKRIHNSNNVGPQPSFKENSETLFNTNDKTFTIDTSEQGHIVKDNLYHFKVDAEFNFFL